MTGKAEELFKAFSTKVTEVIDELKAKNPELFSGDAQKLQVSWSRPRIFSPFADPIHIQTHSQEVGERSLRTVAEEATKLRTRLQAEGQQISPKLEATIKKVYESAVKTATDVQTQAQNAVNAVAKKN